MAQNIFERSFNLNDWLNTIAEESPFGKWEETDEFRELIDDLFEKIEIELTEERLQELRDEYPEDAYLAIEDLFYKITTNDEFHLEYRLPSPKFQNRYWVFKNNKFRVMEITKYEVPDVFKLYTMEEHEGNLENYPDLFPEATDYYLGDNPRIEQIGTHEQDVLTWDEWAGLRAEDEETAYYKDSWDRPNQNGLRKACRHYRNHPNPQMKEICHRIDGTARQLRAHMIAWPVVLIATMVIIMIARMINRRQGASRSTNADKPATLPGKDLPPNYEFVIQFPPEYSEATKNETPPPVENDPSKQVNL